jgi:hypothetical protein
MSNFTIDKVTSRVTPLPTFRWYCNSLPFDMDGNYVESISLPWPTLDVADPLFGGSTFFHYPGMYRMDNFSMVLYEDEKLTTTIWLQAWMALIRDPKTGAYSLPSAYKKPISLTLVDSEEKEITSIQLNGCWPTQMGNFEFNYTESGRITINVTFSVDSLYVDTPSLQGKISAVAEKVMSLFK